jgi:hypothetical protein
MAATAIAKEKEARTWPILLGTTLDDRQIVRGKAVAVAWRNLPIWSALAVNTAAFSILGLVLAIPSRHFFRLFYILGGLVTIVSHVVFLIGIGLYFSARFRSATAAVTATIGSVLAVFILQRFLLSLVFRALMVAMAGSPYWAVILWYIVTPGVRLGIGLLLIWRAKCRLRRNIF